MRQLAFPLAVPVLWAVAVFLAGLGTCGVDAKVQDDIKLHTTVALITIDSPTSLTQTLEGTFATFSGKPPSSAIFTILPSTDDAEGCSTMPSVQSQGQPTAVLVRRGNCTFLQKTLNVQKAGAAGALIVWDDDDISVAADSNDTAELDKVKIFVVSIPRKVGDNVISWNSNHTMEPVVLSIKEYDPPLWDISEAVLLVMATTFVILGAHFSTADLRHGSPLALPREEVLEVTNDFAVSFCIMGSCMLMVLFFFMNYMVYVIIFVFCVGGGSCIVQFVSTWLQYVMPSLRRRLSRVPQFGPVTIADCIAFVPATIIIACWFHFRKDHLYGWIFQDIIGAGFLCMFQRTLRFPNMKVASLLLTIMFFFDVFWVFISPYIFHESVMVTVAKGGDTGETVPMLLRMPAFSDRLGSERMLGFGDIALPGLLVSYLRRHDILSKRNLCSGYFFPCVVGYSMGLVVTFLALIAMRKGQPALLYLVPGTLGTTLVLAWRRGDVKNLLNGTPVLEQNADGLGTEIVNCSDDL